MYRPRVAPGADQRGQHGGQQLCQRRHVTFAIVEDCGALVSGPRSAAQDKVAHFFFLDGADTIQAVVGKRAEQARAADCGNAVGVITELGEKVQYALGHWPAKSKMATDFCAGVIGDEQRSGPVGYGGAAPKSSRHRRSLRPLRNSLATRHTGSGFSPGLGRTQSQRPKFLQREGN